MRDLADSVVPSGPSRALPAPHCRIAACGSGTNHYKLRLHSCSFRLLPASIVITQELESNEGCTIRSLWPPIGRLDSPAAGKSWVATLSCPESERRTHPLVVALEQIFFHKSQAIIWRATAKRLFFVPRSAFCLAAGLY